MSALTMPPVKPDVIGVNPMESMGGKWGWKSTARFYDDLMQAWAEGKFKGILGKHGPYLKAMEAGLTQKAKAATWTRGTHTAAWNTIYGANTFLQLNYEAVPWGLPRKENWVNAGTGWRVASADIATLVTGCAETDALPDPLVPTVNEVENTPRILATRWSAYDLMKLQSRLRDDSLPIEEWGRQYYSKAHIKGIGAALCLNCDTASSAIIESLDRILSCNAELSVSGAPPDANDLDLSGYLVDGVAHDRDAGTGFTDAQLVHNDGVDRQLEYSHLTELARKCRKAGLVNGAWLTNWEAWDKLNAVFEPKQRFMGVSRRVLGINGAETPAGQEVGFEVNTVLGMPVFVTQHIVDSTDEGSRMYLIDLDNIAIKVALPTMLLTSDEADKFALGYFKSDYMYVTIAETTAYKFYSSGKIRDIDIA